MTAEPVRLPTSTEGRYMPSVESLYGLPATVDVPLAGSYFGLGRDASYAAVRRADFPVPVLTVGRRRVVLRAALIALLDPTGEGRP